MTAAELIRAYPDCVQAVSWCELILAGSVHDPFDAFEMWRAAGTNPGTVLGQIRGLIEDDIKRGGPGRNREALEQTGHPSFSVYLSGKLGAM